MLRNPNPETKLILHTMAQFNNCIMSISWQSNSIKSSWLQIQSKSSVFNKNFFSNIKTSNTINTYSQLN